MKAMRTAVLILVSLPLLLFTYLMLAYTLGRRKAARFYERPGYPRDDGVRLDPGAVRALRVLPLIDWYEARDDLEAEGGVSYLVQADGTTILLDLGLNYRGGDRPPLLRNMARLELDPADVDFVVVSHPHLDHMGGMRNQLAKRAVVRQEGDPLAGKPVYSTVPLKVTVGSSYVV
jgi:hypothetical protein